METSLVIVEAWLHTKTKSIHKLTHAGINVLNNLFRKINLHKYKTVVNEFTTINGSFLC
jgi:hypothetical protein